MASSDESMLVSGKWYDDLTMGTHRLLLDTTPNILDKLLGHHRAMGNPSTAPTSWLLINAVNYVRTT